MAAHQRLSRTAERCSNYQTVSASVPSSNEVRGILPDVVVAIRADDGAKFRAALVEAKLPSAIEG